MKKLIRKKLFIGLVLSVLLLGALGSYTVRGRSKSTVKSPSPVTSTSSTDSINYGPPTEEEKAQAEQHKDDLVQQAQQGTQSNSGQKRQGTPVITNASQNGQQIIINTYVQGIVEDAGTCTLTITKGPLKVFKTNQAFANATTTDCKQFTIDRSEFSEAGNWNINVAYSSQKASGVSETRILNIQ